MSGVNKAILIGNLGRDPEVRHLESGRAVANFPIATSETYKNREGERVTHTEWHNIVPECTRLSPGQSNRSNPGAFWNND